LAQKEVNLGSTTAMKSKVDIAVATLKSQGHSVELYVRDGTIWHEIDGWMLVSPQEMEDLANRVLSFLELEDLLKRRQKEERSN
jgi:hypothetical protein